MSNLDNFKTFVKSNPTFANYIKDGTMTWQKFYELYDLYGEDDSVWNEYVKEEKKEVKQETRNNTNSLSNIVEMAKNIDAAKLQDGITSIQKAISLFGDMLTKNNQTTSSNYTPRPVYRRFDD